MNLKKTWKSDRLDEDDKFLRDYLLKKQFDVEGEEMNLG